MWLFQKNLADIDANDINQLVVEQTLESVHLDYKKIPPGTSDPEKEEFRLDVSSMANGSGGMIIYGVAETGGAISSLVGIPNSEIEATTNRMLQVLRTGIEPGLLGVKIHPIKMGDGNSLIALKVLRSFNMPHRVIKSSRFVVRHGAGKIDMSMEEIRAAFLFSSNYLERINNWIDKRVENALTISPLQDVQGISPRRLMIFIVPVSSLDDGNILDVENIAKFENYFQPIGSRASEGRYVAEGFLTHRGTFGTTGELLDYAKVYRNGRIEAVDENRVLDQTTFGEREIETPIINSVNGFLLGLKALDVSPPILIKVVLNGLSGCTFSLSSRFFRSKSEVKEILDEYLPLPPVWLREWSDATDVPKLLKPAFDALWNSAGFPGSPNYENGIYKSS